MNARTNHTAGLSRSLLRGAVDLHIHNGREIFPRSTDAIEAAEQAKAAGMGATGIKNHKAAS